MAGFTDLLEEGLESWEGTRSGVVDELRNLPEKDLAFRPHAGARSVEELVRHIIESGLLMSGELSRPDGDFRRKSYEALLREHGRGRMPKARKPSKKTLLAALARTQRQGDARLRSAGELHMLQQIRRFDGKIGTRPA